MESTTAVAMKKTITTGIQSNNGICKDEKLFLAPLRRGILLQQSASSSSSSSSSSPTSSVLPRNKNTNDTTEKAHFTDVAMANSIHIRRIQQVPTCWIPLHCKQKTLKDANGINSDVDTILGRSNFLSSMFNACGCSNDLKSSKAKCIECRSILSWAGNISRATLKVSSRTRDDHDGVQISLRGSFVAVMLLNGHKIRSCGSNDDGDGDDDDFCDFEEDSNDENVISIRDPRQWSKKESINRGMKVSLRYNEEKLDFLVVSKQDIMYNNNNINNNNDGVIASKMNDSNTITSHNTNKRTKISHHPIISTNSIDKNDDSSDPYCMNTTKSYTKRIWICPRGQDMPRKRIKIMIDRLVSFEKNKDVTFPQQRFRFEVVNQCTDATYWIISDRVLDLATVSKATTRTGTITEDTLKKFLETNDITCVKPSWLDTLFSLSSKSFALPQLPSAKDIWYGYNPKVR